MGCLGTQKCNEEGSALVVALVFLGLLTILGIVAATTSKVEIQISGNQKFHKMAFYAAEASRAYVVKRTDLYGPDNLTLGEGLSFPNKDDPSERYALGRSQSFNGRVEPVDPNEYLPGSVPPRGSGTQVGIFKTYPYRMTCYGYGPSNAGSKVEAGFYRLGF